MIEECIILESQNLYFHDWKLCTVHSEWDLVFPPVHGGRFSVWVEIHRGHIWAPWWRVDPRWTRVACTLWEIFAPHWGVFPQCPPWKRGSTVGFQVNQLIIHVAGARLEIGAPHWGVFPPCPPWKRGHTVGLHVKQLIPFPLSIYYVECINEVKHYVHLESYLNFFDTWMY